MMTKTYNEVIGKYQDRFSGGKKIIDFSKQNVNDISRNLDQKPAFRKLETSKVHDSGSKLY